MRVPAGSREVHFPGSHLNRDGKQARPLLVHLGEPFTEYAPPSLQDPIDETWMRLDPVPVGELEHELPIILSTALTERALLERRRWDVRRLPPPEMPEDLVHTLGPFRSDRFVLAVRAHQHRRLSLTFANVGPAAPTRYRFYDVEVSLDVDLRLLRGPAFWLDWIAHPLANNHTAVFVQKPLERTA